MNSSNKSDSLGFLLFSAARALSGFFNQKLKEHGFGFTIEHCGILFNLSQEEGKTQTNLCSCIGKDKTFVTRLLDNLENGNYLQRRSDTKDRRNNKIYLTESGKELQDKLIPFVKENILAEASKDFSAEEMETLKFLLKKLHHNLNTQNK